MKIVAVTSMYANPIHPGHVDCLFLSKERADELWVIINNDHQAKLKRDIESFQDEKYRMYIVASLKPVDHVILSIDTDGTVCKTLEKVFTDLKSRGDVSKIIFTKGGDRFTDEIPEGAVCKAHSVDIVDGLGDKTHHSLFYARRYVL